MTSVVSQAENKDLRLKLNFILDGRWKIVRIIGEGAFGAVYEVSDLKQANAHFALKLEVNNRTDPSQNMLKLEVTVLRQLRAMNARYCPGYQSCGCNDRFNYLVMGLVGKSVSGMRKSLPRKRFTLGTCIHISNETCRGIEEIHKIGFVHRDIKPANMAIGRPPNDLRRIYILDWGLCRRYINESGQLLPPRHNAPFRGSPRYSSVLALAGREQGRVDDMWSWLFSAIDLSVGTLPWDEGGPSTSNEWFEWLAKEKSKMVDNKECILRGCPMEFVELYDMVRTMDFSDTPDYDGFVSLMTKLAKRKNLASLTLDWEPNSKLSRHTASVPLHSMMQEK